MRIKNVVKVMNFHSLLRVDKARKEADKYIMVERQLRSMICSIVNNRNIVLDYNVFKAPKNKPVLNIYVGSDLGFCGSYNSVASGAAKADDSDIILIGKKIKFDSQNVLLSITKEEYLSDPTKVTSYIKKGITKQKYSEINVFLNNYINVGNIVFTKRRIYPIDKETIDEDGTYTEDYVSESDISELIYEMVSAYVDIELQILIKNSLASENIMRQNSTNDSLKKIDELEEEHSREERKKQSIISSQKNIERYVKQKAIKKIENE